MRASAVLGAWVLVGFAVWNGFFDLYISRGAREFLQRQAEFELGRATRPSLDAVMRDARRAGALAASGWAFIVIGGGFGLYWVGARTARQRPRT